VALLTACNKSERQSYQVFASPEEAGKGLLEAGKSEDLNQLLGILGPGSKEILFSGDPVQDKATVDAFVAGYGVMHRWRSMPDGSWILLVGADNFAFPISLRKNDSGQWFFDTAAGKAEILSRHIGRNELAVIDVWKAPTDAQANYFSLSHDNGAQSNLRRSSSVILGGRTDCTWSLEKVRPGARWDPWWRSQPVPGIA
jgi:hypothetical protein